MIYVEIKFLDTYIEYFSSFQNRNIFGGEKVLKVTKYISLFVVLTLFMTFQKSSLAISSSLSQTEKTLYTNPAKGFSVISKNEGVFVKELNSIKPINNTQISSTKATFLFVNRNNPLPKGYKPKEMVYIDKNKIQLSKKSQLLKVTADALYRMITAAKRDNIKGFIVNSAYRNEAEQKEVFNNWLKVYKKQTKTYKEAYELTRLRVALPGTSEHQTGLSLDILCTSGNNSSTFLGTRQQKWLENNCYKYGFIIRYQKDKTKQTFSMYEPWHIRYMGETLSKFLHDKNYCLEEFYALLSDNKAVVSGSYFFMLINKDRKVYLDYKITNVKIERGFVSKDKDLICLKF
jgi:D-alanyl-D-alanine carboxypeptidase